MKLAILMIEPGSHPVSCESALMYWFHLHRPTLAEARSGSIKRESNRGAASWRAPGQKGAVLLLPTRTAAALTKVERGVHLKENRAVDLRGHLVVEEPANRLQREIVALLLTVVPSEEHHVQVTQRGAALAERLRAAGIEGLVVRDVGANAVLRAARVANKAFVILVRADVEATLLNPVHVRSLDRVLCDGGAARGDGFWTARVRAERVHRPAGGRWSGSVEMAGGNERTRAHPVARARIEELREGLREGHGRWRRVRGASGAYRPA